MPEDESDGQDAFGLVMPFVVCQSEGGPFDDDSFTAGFECGTFMLSLANLTHWPLSRVVHRNNLPQLDLIAMAHNLRMSVLDVVDPANDPYSTWAQVEFSPMSATPTTSGDTPC